MKVLILGSKGNLGQQLVNVFEKNYGVVALDKEELDVTDKKAVLEKISDIKPAIIINAVAYNAVDKCESASSAGNGAQKGFETAKKINGEVVGYLAEAALENNAILIHYSSDYVFRGDDKNGYKEDAVPSPINKYGETKLMGERAIINYSGLKYYIIRTSKLFGPKGDSSASKSSFFNLMINLAKEKNEIDVVDEEISCFTYTPDLAKATKDLLESANKFGIYHIINNRSCTWYEAVKELFKMEDIKVKVNPVSGDKFSRPAKRPKFSILLNTKLSPMRNWRDALKEYLSNK